MASWSANRAHEDLRGALVREVRRLAEGLAHEPLPQADHVALAHARIEPMVRGLFPRAEQDVVLATLEKSVVFLTSANGPAAGFARALAPAQPTGLSCQQDAPSGCPAGHLDGVMEASLSMRTCLSPLVNYLLLTVAMATMACGGGGATDTWPAPPGEPAQSCEEIFAAGFQVELRGAPVRIKAIRNPHVGTEFPLTSYGHICGPPANGWFVVSGSFHKNFLRELETIVDPAFQRALARCPIEYAYYDTVCAPCAPGGGSCPCAERWIPSWFVCEAR